MHCRAVSAEDVVTREFGEEKHKVLSVDGFLAEPSAAILSASLQEFTFLTPQYPGVRAPLPAETLARWVVALAPTLDAHFGQAPGGWTATGWHSIVTRPAADLLPIQRFPHVDGVENDRLAFMLYLHRTSHGGTAFFRHRATGFESLTAERFPIYKMSLERAVAATGLAPAAYVSDGAPHFERVHAEEGLFNRAIIYRGNIFHSGVINASAPLSADPRQGRYTINAFILPARSR